MEESNREMEALLERERPFFWYHALRMTGKPEDAEDLLQDTFMKVCKGFGSYKRDTNFRAWVKKIMLNAHINKMKHKVPGTLSLNDQYAIGNGDPLNDIQYVPDSNNPEKAFFQNHINESIMDLLYSLPDDYKTVFNLYHFEGYSYKSISRVVKTPVGTVKSRIHRAKVALSGKIQDMSFAEETAQ